MSFFDQLKNKAQGLSAQNGQGVQAIGLVKSLLEQVGGVNGIIQKFQQAGHGDTFQSWVSNGENKSISADQVQKVFGSEQLQKIGQQFGVDTTQVSSQLAQYMPNIVDKLTPEGRMPSMEQLKDKLSDVMSFFS